MSHCCTVSFIKNSTSLGITTGYRRGARYYCHYVVTALFELPELRSGHADCLLPHGTPKERRGGEEASSSPGAAALASRPSAEEEVTILSIVIQLQALSPPLLPLRYPFPSPPLSLRFLRRGRRAVPVLQVAPVQEEEGEKRRRRGASG